MSLDLDDGHDAGAFLDETYRLEVSGAELYLELTGPPDAPAVFYLHGGPGYNSHSFRELMGDELLGYRMIYADQRGAGRSPADPADREPHAVATLSRDVVSILDALSLERVTLLAHGFGAMVAADVLARAPERVERLVWVNPWVDMPALAGALQRLAGELSGSGTAGGETEAGEKMGDDLNDGLSPAERVAGAGREVGGKRLFDALLFSKPSSRLRLEHTDAEGFADLHGDIHGGDLSGAPLEEAPGGDVWSLRADLSPLQGHPRPTVVLVGKDDRSCYPAQAQRVLEAAPHALFSLLDSAHYPWLDDPETFTELLHQALSVGATDPR